MLDAGFALALATALGASDLRLDLGVRAEGRSTAYAVSDQGATNVPSSELTPQATLSLDEGELHAVAHYDVRIRELDLRTRVDPDYTHRADVSLADRLDPTFAVSATLAGEQGWTDPLLDMFAPGVSPTEQPFVSLQYEALRARAEGSWTLDRRSTAALAAAASQMCGVGAAARVQLPCQRTESIEGSFTSRGSPRDVTRVGLRFDGTETEGGLDARWGSAWVERREDLTRGTTGRASLGGSVSAEASPGGPVAWGEGPLAELGLAQNFGQGLTGDLSLRTAPAVFRVNGSIQQMASAALTIRFPISDSTALSGSAMDSYAWRGTQLHSTAVDLRFAWRADPRIRLEIGVMGRRQYEPAISPFIYQQVGVFTALVADAPTVR